jgi:hypothetical protein
LNLIRLLVEQYGREPGADSWDMVGEALPSSDPREIALDATLDALFQWEEARKRVKGLEDCDPARSDPTNKWMAVAIDQMLDAERSLIIAILAWDEGFKDWDVHKAIEQHRKPRGIVRHGVGYFVVPDPDRDECEKESDIEIMRLVVVPMASVVDLDRDAGPA